MQSLEISNKPKNQPNKQKNKIKQYFHTYKILQDLKVSYNQHKQYYEC